MCGRRMSEGTIQNILKGNSAKSDNAYEEIRKRIECAPVVGADETSAAVEKQLHWNWIFQTDALTYVYQLKSRGQEAVDSKFPNGLPHSTLVTDRKQTYFKMNVKDHQVCLAHLLNKCRISQRTRHKAGLVSKVYPSASARHRPQTKQNYHAEKDKGAENQDEKPLGRKSIAPRRRV